MKLSWGVLGTQTVSYGGVIPQAYRMGEDTFPLPQVAQAELAGEIGVLTPAM